MAEAAGRSGQDAALWGRLGLWWAATRPAALLSSLVPCLAGGLVAVGSGRARWWLLGVALVAMFSLHAGVNASNDVEDAARGVDGPDKLRSSMMFNTGRLPITDGRRFYLACFTAALLLGCLICVFQGPVLLVIGVLGILGGLLYTAGPKPYKEVGLGEPLIVILMGPLITQGAYTAVTGTAFSAAAFWSGLGPGLIITGVLSANNLEDLGDDRAAGLRTVAVRVGFRRARALYAACLVGAIPVQLALWASGLFDAWILLPLLATPLLLARVRELWRARGWDDPRLSELTARTGQLHLAFSLLLCLGVGLARAL